MKATSRLTWWTAGWVTLLLAVALAFATDPSALISLRPGWLAARSRAATAPTAGPDPALSVEQVIARFGSVIPTRWGERVPGVVTRLDTSEKLVALTFDACGNGGSSNAYDRELIDFLIREQVPATLFINARWIEANPEIFAELAANPLFTIGNHGYLHRPLSVAGRSIYGMAGTASPAQVVDEVLRNERKIEELTGRRPLFFRAGTAYYDEVAVQIVNALGERVIGFDVLGDAGATFNKEQVRRALLSVRPGSIVICHMNHPESETAEGVMAAIPELRRRGYRFVKLDDYRDQLLALQ